LGRADPVTDAHRDAVSVAPFGDFPADNRCRRGIAASRADAGLVGGGAGQRVYWHGRKGGMRWRGNLQDVINDT